MVKKVGSVIKKKRMKGDRDFFRSGIFAAANSGMTVGQAYGIACKNKRIYFKDESLKVDLTDVGVYAPRMNDPDWHKRAAEVYPWAKR